MQMAWSQPKTYFQNDIETLYKTSLVATKNLFSNRRIKFYWRWVTMVYIPYTTFLFLFKKTS